MGGQIELSYGNYVQIAFNAKKVARDTWDSLPLLVQITSIFTRSCRDGDVLEYSKLVTTAHRWCLLSGYHISPAFAKFAHLASGLSVVASFTGTVGKLGPLMTFETETTKIAEKPLLKSWPHKIFELCDWTSSAAAAGENLINFTVLPINLRGGFQAINAPANVYVNLYAGPYNIIYLDEEKSASKYPIYYWMGVAMAVSYIFITMASIGPYVVATAYVTTLFWAKTHAAASLFAVTFTIVRHQYHKLHINPDVLLG